MKKKGSLLDPIIAEAVGIVFFLDGADVEKSATSEFGFFCVDGILNHSANDLGGRPVQAADEDEVVGKELTEGANPFIRKVGIGNEAVGGQAAEGQEGEF